MRERTIKKQFWINQEEDNLLKAKAKKTGLNESEFLISCIKGYKIKTIKSNLQAVINYGKNGEKTEHGILVSGINCNVATSYEEMALTKKFFHKEGKTLGYHLIQSFKGYEVPPEKANQI